MKMAKEAVSNYFDFIEAGVERGTDPESVVREMGKESQTKFKEDLEAGISRICALASSGCHLFSSAILKACKSMQGPRG